MLPQQSKQNAILILVLYLSFLNTIVSFAQPARITQRAMTDQEFCKLIAREGIFEKGRNYNKIIDGHGTGLKPPTLEEWQKIRNLPVLIDKIEFQSNKASPKHDNSATIWFPPIGNQDGEGSCVAWACGYYTKTFQEAKEHDWDLSGCPWEGGFYGHPGELYQDKIFSPDFIYHQVNGGKDNGSYYSDNMDLLERIGCCTWDKMPYEPSDTTTWPGEDAWRQAPWYRSQTGFGYLEVDTDATLGDLKQFIADTNLVIISVNANYYDNLTSDDLWTLDNYKPSDRNHANTIVGYDDNYGPYTESGNPNTYGAFKVTNSWGIGGSWENVADGFFYISDACMKQRVEYVFFYINRLYYEPEMIAVFNISHDNRGDCEITVGIGNTNSTDTTKRFDDYNKNGGDQPFPANNMVMDITEFKPFMSGAIDTFFLQTYDGGSATSGTINLFSIELYDDYISGVPSEVYVSKETPLNTIDLATVEAEVTTEDNVIPVELSLFIAEARPGSIKLKWRTETETKNYGFYIYRSSEKKDRYMRLNTEIIRGAGTSVQSHNYNYQDQNVHPGNSYYYKLVDVDLNGNMNFHGPINATAEDMPTGYKLEQNFPNPFNPETGIHFTIKEIGKVTLKVYNLSGQLVRILVDEERLAGHHSAVWNGTDDQGIPLASGMYYYTLKVNDFEETKKLIYLR